MPVDELGVELNGSSFILQSYLEQNHFVLLVLKKVILVVNTFKLDVVGDIVNYRLVKWLHIVELL